MKRLQFWFDFSCPYAYVSSRLVEGIAERAGAELELQPMLLGGVFKARATPQVLFKTLGEAKARHNANDIRRTAARNGVTLEIPGGHPFRTVEALRCLLAVGEPFGPLMHAFYRAYWVDGVDISTEAGLTKVLTDAGHDAAAILKAAGDANIKDDLRARTDRALALGIFGAPSFVVGDELFYGTDRLHQVEQALSGSEPQLGSVAAPNAPIDFWFDYSSPFAYLGAERVHQVGSDRVRYKPMLLGAVFKMIEQAQVPLYEMTEAKQTYMGKDLSRQSAAVGCPYSWPSRFPMNTVLPLRVTIAAEQNPALVQRLFRAYWAEDQDISQPEVVAAQASAVGLDGSALVEAAQTPEVKGQLRTLTSQAVESGVFGAPTFIAHPARTDPKLYWGSDRFDLAVRAANGDEQVW